MSGTIISVVGPRSEWDRFIVYGTFDVIHDFFCHHVGLLAHDVIHETSDARRGNPSSE